MKKNYLKKKSVVLCLAMLLVCCLAGCGGSSSSEDNTWPNSGLGLVLPEPDAKKIHIGYNLDDSFSADIEDAKEEDFTAYVDKCKEIGFTIDAESDLDDYAAYNADGYKVSITFYDSIESVSIMLDAPKINGTITWPTMGLATLLPTPNTDVGTISIDSSTLFEAWIGETSFDNYKIYVNQCIENGFDIDYSNSEKAFTADNVDGVTLCLEYQGFDTMYISIDAPDGVETAADEEDKVENSEVTEADTTIENETITSEENEETEENTDLVDGMRPEFKEAMDSYEAFMNKYCDFMIKYAESPEDLDLIAEYADYVSQYTETMEKIDAIDEEELSDAELAYYLEVTGRVTQKLAGVAM